ncbi:MAG: hydroxyacid dehydrogenase [Lawsonibacter sp.]|nr:hydroxyacid dehydrogenase [Lawsonibacter sp.]
MKRKVLLIQPTIQPVGVEILKEHCDVYLAPDGSEETLIRCLTENACDAVVTRVEQITARVIEACPTLKVIGQHGVGLDNIDVQAATARGIQVLNVPDANYVSVAEHAMMFVLALSRNLRAADQAVRTGNWKFRETNIPNEVAGKTLVIVGLGTIGRDVAQKALAFHMNVVGFDAYVSAERMTELHVQKAQTLQQALELADFLTIHAPLTPETRGMFSTEQFRQMKKTACLINLGRGPVVDQAALAAALRDGEIAGAALDVFESEPPDAGDPLFALPNVIVTPHFGGDTIDAKRRCSQKLAETVVQALSGQTPYNLFNRKALEERG